MKELFTLIKTTLIGGLIFLVPFFLIVVIILKAVEIMRKIVTPWAAKFGLNDFAGRTTITIIVASILVLICLVAGLIMKSGKIQSRFPAMDIIADNLLPGYEVLKAQSSEIGVDNIKNPWQAIYLKIDDGWCIGFIVGKKNDDYSAIFIPHIPKMDEGDLRILPTKTMEFLPISTKEARLFIRRFGFGAAESLSKLKT